MADFDFAYKYMRSHEGEVADNPSDRGGYTYRGLTLKLASRYGFDTEEKLLNITEEDMKRIYQKEFWRFDQVNSNVIAAKIFDHAANIGLHRTITFAQLALAKLDHAMIVDGIFGKGTLSAVNACADFSFLEKFCAILWDQHYVVILARSVLVNPHIYEERKQCIIDSVKLTEWPAIKRVVKVLGPYKADQLQFAQGWHDRAFAIPHEG